MSSFLKSSGVEMEKSGLHMTNTHSGRGGSGESTSPRPSASTVPPLTQNGTSDPTSPAISSSRASLTRRSKSSFIPRRTAAASALPPAMPAPTGIRLYISISAPCTVSPISLR